MRGESLTSAKTILLVMSSKDLQKTLLRFLDQDHNVICSDSPMAAALLLETGGFDAVLSDLNFKDDWLNGVDLINCLLQSQTVLKKQNPRCKFGLMSGGHQPANLPSEVCFLQRPFMIAQLTAFLHEEKHVCS